MGAFTTVTLFLGFFVVYVDAFRYFQNRLPSGGIVPDPCRSSVTWEAVGHINAQGGAARNVFGEDFYKNGMKWDRCICDRDSDGDGRTNGEELGDPNCEWEEGDPNPSVPQDKLSHPGICEPLNDTNCQKTNDWNVCAQTNPNQFTSLCPAVNQDGVMSKELEFPEVNIPAKQSTYKCMSFEVPTDNDYHIIGAQPNINNPNIVHHMVVIGCDNGDNLPSEPVDCSSIANKCKTRTWLMIWRLGSAGYCAGNDFGFKIGKTGFKRVILAIHWKNSEAVADLKDSSGLTIFYTANLRSNDAAMLSVGISTYELPKGLQLLDFKAKCTAKCTKRLQTEIQLADGILHKYYLGAPPGILSTRNINGGDETVLITSSKYEHDSIKKFVPAVAFSSDEELETTGGAVAGANAYSLLTYYPASAGLNFCMQYKGIDVCAYPDREHMKEEMFGKCNLTKFFKQFENNLSTLKNLCSMNCTNDCEQKIDEFKAADSCLQGEESKFLEKVILGTSTESDKEFFKLLRRCEINEGENDGDGQPMGTGDEDSDDTSSPATDTDDGSLVRPCVFSVTNSANSIAQVNMVKFIFITSILCSFF